MSVAAKKSRAIRQAEQRAGSRSKSAAMTFLVFEDNGGDYCWAILDRDGKSLAHSRPYATHDDAAYAAGVVREGARSAGS